MLCVRLGPAILSVCYPRAYPTPIRLRIATLAAVVPCLRLAAEALSDSRKLVDSFPTLAARMVAKTRQWTR
jgi:hypothetical protein